MFKSLRSVDEKKINHSGRSHIGETMQIEGDLRTAGSIGAKRSVLKRSMRNAKAKPNVNAGTRAWPRPTTPAGKRAAT